MKARGRNGAAGAKRKNKYSKKKRKEKFSNYLTPAAF
jgi:hypothetical protein